MRVKNRECHGIPVLTRAVLLLHVKRYAMEHTEALICVSLTNSFLRRLCGKGLAILVRACRTKKKFIYRKTKRMVLRMINRIMSQVDV